MAPLRLAQPTRAPPAPAASARQAAWLMRSLRVGPGPQALSFPIYFPTPSWATWPALENAVLGGETDGGDWHTSGT